MHIGSQLFDLEPWRLAVEAIATLGDFPAYDLGGGLAVAYTPDRRPPTVAEYVGEMRRDRRRAARARARSSRSSPAARSSRPPA